MNWRTTNQLTEEPGPGVAPNTNSSLTKGRKPGYKPPWWGIDNEVCPQQNLPTMSVHRLDKLVATLVTPVGHLYTHHPGAGWPWLTGAYSRLSTLKVIVCTTEQLVCCRTLMCLHAQKDIWLWLYCPPSYLRIWVFSHDFHQHNK